MLSVYRSVVFYHTHTRQSNIHRCCLAVFSGEKNVYRHVDTNFNDVYTIGNVYPTISLQYHLSVDLCEIALALD